jgi:DNA-binding transcriptional LysR family regulator
VVSLIKQFLRKQQLCDEKVVNIMEINNLEAFILLARSLNFTKSAEQMFLSQSAFSRKIIRIEQELDCQLFKRTKRSVELTDFGKIFLEHADKIVSEYNKGIFHISRSSDENSHLKLGLLNDLIDETFPRIINRFQDSNPLVDLIFSDYTMSGLINSLLRGDIDCAYTLSHDTKNISDISSFTVWSRPLNVAMSCNHPLASRESIRIEDLAGCPFVLIMPDTYNLGMIHVNYLCKNAGFTPIVAAMVSNINSLLMLVNSNIGVALTAQTAAYNSPKGVKFFPVLANESSQIETEIAILWKTNNANPAIPLFVETAQKLINEDL